LARRRPRARLVVALGSAAVVAATPAFAAFAGPVLSPAARTMADVIQNCSVNQTKGSAELNCAPNQGAPGASAGANGLPSESDLTQQNDTRHH